MQRILLPSFTLILFMMLCLSSTSLLYAQAPQLLNYQGVARNSVGNAIPNKNMTLRLTVRHGSATGSAVYSETRQIRTNGAGLFVTQIGSAGASSVTGTLVGISWLNGSKFLQVELDPEGGNSFLDMGTTQLVSVPYALSAETAGGAPPTGQANGDLTGSYPNPSISNSAVSTIKLADAAVTSIKIADQAVSTSKIANGAVNDTKITDMSASKLLGTVDIVNGGTAANSALGARVNLGLGNVDNTSDINKPISAATLVVLNTKEELANKSTNPLLGNSDQLYPTQKAVKTYVDGQVLASTPDASSLVKGKLKLAGDLTGTPDLPRVADAAVTTTKINDAAVTTVKISDAAVTTAKINDAAVTTAKITDAAVTTVKINDAAVTTTKINDAAVTTVKISDAAVTTAKINDAAVTDAKIQNLSASKITGAVALLNGGTGATTAAAARTNLDLGNVDNTADLAKPISTATQTALNTKEDVANKSVSTGLGTSDVLYPTQKAVKTYVDDQITANATSDATNLVSGKIKLAGDLTGSAALPTIANGVVTTTKLADLAVTDIKIASVAGSKVNGNISGNAANVTGVVEIANGGTGATTVAAAKAALSLDLVDNTSDLAKPISTAAQTVLNTKEDVSNKSTNGVLGTSDVLYPTEKAVKTYVDAQVGGITTTSSVGAISNTSTANGATITAGVLKLAPADDTNGGVITSGTQSLAGDKTFKGNTTFDNNATIREANVGTFGAPADANTVLGKAAFGSATSGSNNTGLGYMALKSNSGSHNTAVGANAMNQANTSGSYNVAVGSGALATGITGNNNTSVGYEAGKTITSGSNNTLIGKSADVSTNSLTNATAIGSGAIVSASNTIQLGNTSIDNVNTSGSLTANAAVTAEITSNLTITSANAETYKSKILICNPTSPITITFSSGLPVGFNCMVLQKSSDANVINFAAGAGVTLKNRNSFVSTAGSYAVATIVHIGSNIVVTAGDMQ